MPEDQAHTIEGAPAERILARQIYFTLLYPDRRLVDRFSKLGGVPRYTWVASVLADDICEGRIATLKLRAAILRLNGEI